MKINTPFDGLYIYFFNHHPQMDFGEMSKHIEWCKTYGYKTLDPAIDPKAAAHFKLVFGGTSE